MFFQANFVLPPNLFFALLGIPQQYMSAHSGVNGIQISLKVFEIFIFSVRSISGKPKICSLQFTDMFHQTYLSIHDT